MTKQAVTAAEIAQSWPRSSFTYRGPMSGVTLRRAGVPSLEVMFYDGATVELPCDHPYVIRLVAQGYLTVNLPAPSTAPAPASTPANAGKSRRASASSADSSTDRTADRSSSSASSPASSSQENNR